MKTESVERHVSKMALLTEKDEPEYNRIRDELIKVLKRMGGYEPASDDFYIDTIAKTAIYTKKVEFYVDSETATLETYAKFTDIKLKQSKILDSAINQLALSRRERIGKKTESSLMNELREAMLRGLNDSGKQ